MFMLDQHCDKSSGWHRRGKRTLAQQRWPRAIVTYHVAIFESTDKTEEISEPLHMAEKALYIIHQNGV